MSSPIEGGCKNQSGYQIAIAEIHKLSVQLKAMSCQRANEKSKGDLGRYFQVQDLVVDLNKRLSKEVEMGPLQQRKCNWCGNKDILCEIMKQMYIGNEKMLNL